MAGGRPICVFRSPVAELKLAPFGRPRSPFLHLVGRYAISFRPSLSLLPNATAFLSLPPGCSLGSLSSPVRASNPSWTKVLPAPSHIGRTFPHPDARRSQRLLHRIRDCSRDRSSRFRFLRMSRSRTSVTIVRAIARHGWI